MVKFFFLIGIFQILLLMNTISAQSYIIHQTDSLNYNSNITENNSEDFIGSIIKILSWTMGFLSIDQIGVVSAQNIYFNCCVETNNGAICQNVISGVSSSEPGGCENPLPTSCEESSMCRLGTCVQGEGLSCAANSPKQECENNNGVWKSLEINEIAECEKGACVLGSNIQLTTKKQCELLSKSSGLEMDFRPGMTELDFPGILGILQEGACVLEQGNCRFVTINECDNMNGKFYENFLCSNPNLATNCVPTEQTTCVKDKIHFIDSCGNPANVYDSSKVNADSNSDYWGIVSEPTCTLDLDDPNSVKSCGNCNIFLSSVCSEASNGEVSYGNYVCKNLECVDEKGNTRKNGERWCVYDSYIGDGKDTVGSEHWLASCNFGELEVDLCGGTRGQICSQRIIEGNGKEFSTAACVVNEALRCLNYNQDESMEENCNDNSQCEIKNVNIDKYFKFSMCTPEYPRGFDLTEKSEINSGLCSLGNQECTVIYQKKIFGGWRCIANCACQTKKFTEQLNNLCISLGDCGSYVNFIGDGTKNIEVKGAPDISWTQYKNYAEPVEGKYIELEEQSDFLASIGAKNIYEYTPEEYNKLIAQLGISGVWFLGELYLTGSIFELGYLVDIPATGSMAASFAVYGIAAVGSIIGSLAGEFIADYFGISGTAATVIVMASGVAGAAGALMLAESYGLISLYPELLTFLGWTFIIAIVIIALIAILGWGKTKQVKVNFSCLPWQAPIGGDNCEKCNEDDLKPCTKYRCDSLGQACKLLNENTDKPVCQTIAYETTPPKISPGEVKTQGHKFQNQESQKVELRRDNGECLQEFSPVEFTLKTDEFAQCKWGFQRGIDYESMENYPLDGTYFSTEHTFVVGGIGLSILEANNVSGDLIKGFVGNVNMFVRCQDYFGNFNLNEYTVNFCINSGKDTTPVLHYLTTTLPKEGSILKKGIKDVDLAMWINEPAECKYDVVEGKNYNDMEISFNCGKNLTDRESFGWPCETSLTNLQNEISFYIKCKDQPWLGENESRNINVEDFVYKLHLSEDELKIDSIYILHNDIKTDLNPDTFTEIKGEKSLFSSEVIVETIKGADNGNSLCSYQWNGEWITFFNSNSNIHKQKLTLLNGDYNIPIKCIDLAENEATMNAKFSLNIDNSPPKAIRVYYESGKLILITDEQAKCYVSFEKTKQCGFDIDNADVITPVFSSEHSIDWYVDRIYYIKCEDLFNNQNPSCVIKVSPSPL